jgi:LPS export ABC transporter permease LptF/LPS export ABC transporter permease LptG
MRLLSRVLFREIFVSALLGTLLFTFVVFMQKAGPLFEFLVRNSGPGSTVAYLFVLVLPQALPYSIPLGTLAGALITLSRMSSDGEITAIRAGGVSGRVVARPILCCAALGMLVTAAASLWLTPWSVRERYRILNDLISGQLTAEVQPRVFQEQFPNHILHVADVVPGTAARWRRIFLADITPPDKLPPGAGERGDAPRVTISPEAIAVPDVVQNRVQLTLERASTYEAGKNPSDYRIITFDHGDQALQANRPSEVRVSRPALEMDTGPLYRAAYLQHEDALRSLEAKIELHQRLVLPLACILLALAGIPLGITSRRAGKSSAIVLTVALAFLYYMGLISMISMARQGSLPPALAVWLPNIVFAVSGVVMLGRLEAPGDHDLIGRMVGLFQRLGGRKSPLPGVLERIQPRVPGMRFLLLPQVADTYILGSFLFYFVLLLASFVMMTHVFTFFELLSDIIKNRIAIEKVLTYHFFLTPRFVYDLAPVAVLTSVLVVFAVLTKNNEVTAFKACGISVFRLMVPVLMAAAVLSGALFAFDHYWVPEADRIQDQIRAEIKGRPAQTFLNPNRRWISGLHDRVYYYKYFDQAENTMLGVNVYDIDWAAARLKRHISAERARWEPGLKAWVFQNGWSVSGKNLLQYDNFAANLRSFPDLDEPPDYFVKEVKQSRQMNFRELQAYIDELQLSGFDTVALQVQYHQKFAVPLFALILAMVSIPFAFQAGNKGAMAGVGMSFAIFIAYWSVRQLFEQVGNLSQLPPAVAAWSPDTVFSLAGLYLMARMRT